jgi:hypothetical protein
LLAKNDRCKIKKTSELLANIRQQKVYRQNIENKGPRLRGALSCFLYFQYSELDGPIRQKSAARNGASLLGISRFWAAVGIDSGGDQITGKAGAAAVDVAGVVVGETVVCWRKRYPTLPR